MKIFPSRQNRSLPDLYAINQHLKYDPKGFVEYVEERFKSIVSNVVKDICKYRPKCKIIFVSGPSSSGKTTFSSQLAQQLHANGLQAVPLSLDDFYLATDDVPVVLEDGSKDLECIEALNLDALEECLKSILKNGFCDKPVFNFAKHKPEEETVRLTVSDEQIVIVEGIHALNPLISSHLPDEKLSKVYISVNHGVNDMNRSLLSKADVRLFRRLLRDHISRDTTFRKTIKMWDNVCAGEIKYIKPFKRTCNVAVDSFHMYEPALMRAVLYDKLEPSWHNDEYDQILMRKKRLLERFEPLDPSIVPDDSLIREFCGK